MTSNKEKFFELLKNEFFATFVCFVVLAIVGLVSSTAWFFLFAVILSYVLSDVILNFFVHGGEGWAKIFSDTQFSDKGYAFLAFLGGIIIGTLVTSVIADVFVKYVQTQLEWMTAVILTDLVAVALVLLDLEWRFYRL
jgi:hypothetical protein